MDAAEACAATAAEGLQLQASENSSGFKCVFARDASLRKSFQAVYADESLGYYTTPEAAALAYARMEANDPKRATAKAEAAARAAKAAAKAATAERAAEAAANGAAEEKR